MRKNIVIVACILQVAVSWDFISKNCCPPHDDEHLGRICDDGSRAPLIGCCGNGPCNVACCNCDNGCISGKHKPYKLLGVWGAEIRPNFGLTGNSAPVAGSEFVEELAKTAAKEIGKGTYAIGSAAAKNPNKQESDIEYHKWN
ncbi:unnamed protein product [Diatraea saccharalis]|uniref:Uncharacterized protein n=1 Tax=Diatraea saccharalis TaxID=40085 RepID=A0A9N9R038_9NEOP|nr:unnamed protein product [Diatraea saccharalis]